ncbi:MAG: hypothetical protein QXH07_03070 [Thermoplasmata archaeon]
MIPILLDTTYCASSLQALYGACAAYSIPATIVVVALVGYIIWMWNRRRPKATVTIVKTIKEGD